MKLTIGGVRGSSPVAQPEFMKYGGETTSFLIEGAGGERILVDGGTGIRHLGRYLMQTPGSKSVWLFMTHYHLDHVAGLPMLPLLYSPDWDVIMAAPDHKDVTMREIMAKILDTPFWPLQVEDLKSGNQYLQLDGIASASPFICGGIEVRWCPLHHPGECTAYRFDEPSTGASVVIATDVEWGLSAPGERGYLEQLLSNPNPAELLIMDGQYEQAMLEKFRGWGHSSWQEAVELAVQTRVRNLLISHHDPYADDDKLDAVREQVKIVAPFADLARVGMSLDLPVSNTAQQ
ncbi:MAG TPA: MBL fold metallo-hydrolase [Kiritimatiellia bacterium]|nr:MBL fold metallo-hydrolase [Kiritimatiellia bacterium]